MLDARRRGVADAAVADIFDRMQREVAPRAQEGANGVMRDPLLRAVRAGGGGQVGVGVGGVWAKARVARARPLWHARRRDVCS